MKFFVDGLLPAGTCDSVIVVKMRWLRKWPRGIW